MGMNKFKEAAGNLRVGGYEEFLFIRCVAGFICSICCCVPSRAFSTGLPRHDLLPKKQQSPEQQNKLDRSAPWPNPEAC